MIDLILNVKNRVVISQLSVEGLVESIKNPSNVHKSMINEARNLDRKSKKYKTIKENLPCIVPNYNHDSYVKASTIKNSTGFIYIDVDDNSDSDINPEEHPFIVAKWKSLSGIGSGYLISVDNKGEDLSKSYLQKLIMSVSNDLDINPDLEAISRDRLNVISYDKDVYYNPNYTQYKYKDNNLNIESNNINKNTSSNYNSNNTIRLLKDDNFYSKDIRMTNFDTLSNNYTFESDEVFKDLKDNKLKYAEVYIPKNISNGSRNSRLFKIISLIYGLNPNIEFKRLLGFSWSVNTTVCEEPLEESEVTNLVKKIHSTEPELFSNKEKRFIFNRDYMLTGKERKSIAITESNLQRGNDTTNLILDVINDWDFEKYGKITYKKIAKVSGKSYPTVSRRKEDIKEIMKIMNKDLKKVA